MGKKAGILERVAEEVGNLRVTDKRASAADLLRPPSDFVCTDRTSMARGRVVAPSGETPEILALRRQADEAMARASAEEARINGIRHEALQRSADVAEARRRHAEKVEAVTAAEGQAKEIASALGGRGWHVSGRAGWVEHWVEQLARVDAIAHHAKTILAAADAELRRVETEAEAFVEANRDALAALGLLKTGEAPEANPVQENAQ